MVDDPPTGSYPKEPAGSSHVPERRRATVVYADLTGSTRLSETRDPEELYEIIGGCLQRLEATARRHGSTLIKSRGDGVLAVFGLPTALEHASRAAVNAAIEMRDEVAQHSAECGLDEPLLLHTGINTGLMVSGAVALGAQGEVDVLGDAVNVAARLSDLAPPGATFVGDATYRDTAREFRYRPAQRMRVKGKDRSVAVHELLSRRTAIHRVTATALAAQSSGLVDRTEEVARLERRVEALAAGEGGVVCLVGEAGLGKSRLVAELHASAQEQAVDWREGRSRSLGENLRYHVIGDLLRSVLGSTDDEGPDAARDRLEKSLEAWLPDRKDEVLPFLAPILGVDPGAEHIARLESVTGEARERMTQMGVRLLLSRMAERRPLLLVLEDLHWSDRASADLVESLLALAASAPILFVCVSRPDPDGAITRLASRAGTDLPEATESISLTPLSDADCEALLDQLVARDVLSTAIRRRIVANTGGNPFFVEEVLQGLVRNEGEDAESAASSGTLDASSIPNSVQDAILVRLEALGAGEQEVIRVASVFGTRVAIPLLSEVVAKDDVEELLDRLIDARLLARAPDGGLDELVFQHAMIRDVVYESMLRAIRRELHGRAGEAIRARVPPQSVGYDGMLAYHAILAGDLVRAEEHLFRAGEEASRVAAAGEALRFFQEASRLYLEQHAEKVDPEKLATLEKHIAYAFFHRGELTEALVHFGRWLELLGESVPHSRARAMLRTLWNFAVTLRTAFRSRIPDRPPASDRQREIIAMMFDRLRAQTTASPERFILDALETFRLLSRVDPRTVPGAGGMIASGGLGIFGFTGLSFRVGRRLLDYAEPVVDEDDPRDRFLARSMAYYHDCFEGSWGREHELDDASIEAALSLGDLWDVVTYLGVDGFKKIHQGRFVEAERSIERLRRLEQLYAYDLAGASHRADATLLALVRGTPDEALASAEAYRRFTDEPLPNLLALGFEAKAHALRGELQAARVCLETAKGLARQFPLLPPFHGSAYLRSRLLVDVLRLEQEEGAAPRRQALRDARRSARAAARIARRVAWDRTEIYGLLGRLAWRRGRRRRAIAWWNLSLEAGRALEARPELAEVHRDIAARIEGAGDVLGGDASWHRSEAVRLLRDLRETGAPADGGLVSST